MRRHLVAFILWAVLAAFLQAPVDAKQPSLNIPTKKHVLKNGMTVLVSEMPSSPIVAIYALVKTGSATEGKYLGTGISHFLEHMLFKGTAKRGVGQISQEIQAMGGTINAATSFDYTIYTMAVPYDKFEQAMDIMADMLMNSKFDADEIEKEREVVFGEMRMHNDRPERVLSHLTQDTVYLQHPYRLPIIGFEELLRPLRREDFLDYYKTHYVPGNIVFAVAGRIDGKAALPKIAEAFQDFQRQRYQPRNLVQEPQQVGPRRAEKEYSTELTRMSMAYSGVGMLHEDMVPLDILAMILGQGASSRLYQSVYKRQGLVRSVSASNFTPVDRGTFEIECVLDDSQVDKALEAVKAEVSLLQKGGVAPKELEKAKRQVLSQFLLAFQTAGSVASHTAYDEAFTGDFGFSGKYIDAVNAVTPRDIQRVAKQYLVGSRESIVILRPRKPAVEEKSGGSVSQAGDVEMITLDNGLKVLLRENHAFPIVSIQLSMGAGFLQEPPELNGLADLTARLWTKSTKSLTSSQLSETVESHGISLWSYSGRNSMGIAMQVLNQDTEFGMDLLRDFIQNPGFREEDFLKTKEEMLTAVNQRDDSVVQQTLKTLREVLFEKHPFRFDPLGTSESLANIQMPDPQRFLSRFLSPKNMVIAVYGDINKQDVLRMVADRMAGLRGEDVALEKVAEAPPSAIRTKAMVMEKEQAMVAVAFQGPDLYSPDRYKVSLLSSILGSSFSGRMFTQIRDEGGQAYALGGDYIGARDMGMVYFYVLTDPGSAEEVRQKLTGLIDEIRAVPVPDQELADMKAYLKGSFLMGLQTDQQLSFVTTMDELNGLGYNYYQSYDQKIDEITPADIQRLAQTYLDWEKSAVVVTMPKPAEALAKP
ncbi:MAG: pitrilysin family protein [Candidatus Omnitrophota bacterium]|nr:pitrilysin family protein [Candidatus Omnitrophota bacterium]